MMFAENRIPREIPVQLTIMRVSLVGFPSLVLTLCQLRACDLYHVIT
jgi:hypothetical protein